jgi:hypothetical protein
MCREMGQQSDQEQYNDLSYYTLAHSDPSFVHQLIVDAYTAQHAGENTKPIAITFALIGLYLHTERDFSGKQVQRAHVQLAAHRKQWPKFTVPEQSGDVTVSDVLGAPPGPERDEMIHRWCASVWEAWNDSHQPVRDLVRTELGI